MISTERVQLGGLAFELFLEARAIEKCIEALAFGINAHYGEEQVSLVVVLDGAGCFFQHLHPKLRFPWKSFPVRIKTYDGLHASQAARVNWLDELNDPLAPVLILEDIVETGKTLDALCQDLRSRGMNDLRIASLLWKPSCTTAPVVPDFVGKEIGPEFVVGFGMDYCGDGRTLASIYRLPNAGLEKSP
ncbi:MAG: hypothetical protein IT266_03155 [Saprospiraceae bacterium]|nr:hypothetical protein [Saprospiraceae bacterium]